MDTSIIPGWGIDADPENRPAYPMRDYSQDDKGGMNWLRPPQQPATTEILHSTERPSLAAVFGTSCPPRGLSGMIRRVAFKSSEGKWSHWFLLLFADRINVIEGIFEDLFHGYIPNIFAEMGLRAELRYNRRGFIKKIFVICIILAAIIAIIAI